MSTEDPLCPACHVGKLHVQKVTYSQVYEEQLIVVPNVSALVCDICGERVVDSQVLSRLSGLLGLSQQITRPITGQY